MVSCGGQREGGAHNSVPLAKCRWRSAAGGVLLVSLEAH